MPTAATDGRTRPAAIRFRGWGRRYPDRDVWAVRGVDLDVRPGERVAVVGASGSGKSTLLRAVAGVLGDDDADGTQPGDVGAGVEEGGVLVDGQDPRRVRGRVGLVMQDPEAHTVMSRIGDDVAFGPENLGVPRAEIGPRVREALALVGLELPLDRSTSAMSGGQRQRLALAGVLAMRPGALVLDEPCANLDPDGVRQVHDAVRDVLVATGATLLVVEHRIGTWLDLVDRLVLLTPGGGIAADGAPEEVLARHGTALTAAGVWVPGAEPDPRPLRTGGELLLRASGLATARGRRSPVGHDIDTAVRTGRVLGVTGPNGVGKSTLGLTLAGLFPPAGGVLAASDALAAGAGPMPSRWSSRDLAARVGTVLQDPGHQFVARSVREELAVGPVATGLDRHTVDERVDAVLAAFGLDALADANPFTLSGGEQRRLAIGTAIVARPPVVVLDEPTSGQDRTTWQAIVDRLTELADAGSGIVAVTHDATLLGALGADELRLAPARVEAGAA
ncbi:ABC transporter ATP-binding protein [Curtobacterium sp. MCBD17_013]|uniref:ABC transporter ATP-binding protein n=1 Tax=Curtobacterium sp. MCBD17_013 TaxID=2175668 RepID=UPI000DA9999F|nr:ABC transporter ATP-binding protein [Curtobacterium sp. MCBD17_013]PZF57227.1 ABC transporter ATP-binding protein [Curtobacterium sp. MCBD17_013]